MSDAMARACQGIRRHGVGGSIRRVTSFVSRSLRSGVFFREQHIWYALDLARGRQTVAIPAGLELTCNSADALLLLAQLPTIGQFEARERLASGAQLWTIREGDRAAFACWIFRGRAPALAARGGWLALPPGVVCLEDSVTSPLCRGRGMAPAAWSGIADALIRQGADTMITKVAEQNVASRRAVEKAGFRAVAFMKAMRIGAAWRVAVQPEQRHLMSSYLIEHLAR